MKQFAAVIALCLLTIAAAADVSEPQYTQQVEVFKKDNLRGRMQVLLGCWLMGRDFEKDASEPRTLSLLKACMKRITRKDSVLKITSLIGKNLAPPKTYQEVVGTMNIPAPFEAENQPSEFDKMLLQYVRGYAKDIDGIERGKEGEQLRKKVEEEITKRQKYYLGIIPVNQFTHTIMLIVTSVLMVIVCTCWKKYTRKEEKKEGEQSNENSYFCKDGHKHSKKQGQGQSFTKSPTKSKRN